MLNDSSIESVAWHPEQASLLITFSSEITTLTRGVGKSLVLSMEIEAENVTWQCGHVHPLIISESMNNRDLPRVCPNE